MSAVVSTKAAGGTLTITATKTAAAGAVAVGTVFNCDLRWDPRVAVKREIIIPISELWLLTDLYIASQAATGDYAGGNPILEFRKDTDRVLDYSQPVDNVFVGLNARPNGLHANLQYEGGTHMSVNGIVTVLTAAGAGALAAYAPYEKKG